jgi:hypothetical protein
MKPDKTYLSIALLIIVTAAAGITSCTHKSDISGLPVVCFERDILPIYTNSCAISGCHDGRGRESGRALNNYNDIVSTVVPGNPGGSSSYKAIISKWGENKMPPDQPISLDNRTLIRVWIEQGAMNTICTVATVTSDHFLSEKQNIQN